MRKIIFTTQFKRDVKLAEKRHKDTSKLLEVFQLLAGNEFCRNATKTIRWVEIGSITGTCISNQTGC